MFRIIKLEPRIVLDGNTPPHMLLKNPLPGNEIVMPLTQQVQGKTPPLNVIAGHDVAYDVSQHIVDDDGDSVTYKVDSVDADWLKGAAFDGSSLKIPEATDVDAGKTYEIHFSASDGQNQPVTFSFKLTVAENTAPHQNASSPLPEVIGLNAGKTLDHNLSQYITDTEKDLLTYSFSPDSVKPLDDFSKNIRLEGSHLKIDIAPTNSEAYKNYTINFTVSDEFHKDIPFSLNLQILPNLPPHQNYENPLPGENSPFLIKVGAGGEYDLKNYITDDEQDSLKYIFVPNNDTPDWLKGASFDGSKLKISAPTDPAEVNKTYPVSFMVSDGINEQKFSFSLKVAANTAPYENASDPLNHADSPITLAAGKTLDYDVSTHITDNEKDTLRYTSVNIVPIASDASTDWLKGAKFDGSHIITAYGPLLSDAGKLYEISFIADDGVNQTQFSATLKVLSNEPPYENSDNLLPGHNSASLTTFKGQALAYNLSNHFTDPEKDTLIFYPNSIVPLDGGGTDWFTKSAAFDKNGVLTIPAPDTSAVGKHYIINFWMGDGVNPLKLYSIPLTIPNRAPTFPDGYSLQLNGGKATISATDLDGDTLIYSISGKEAQAFTINAKTGELILNNPKEFDVHQEFTLDLIATEDKVGGVSTETQVKVTINSPPQENTVNPKPSLLIFNSQQPFSYDLAQHYTDPDNDSLKYTYSDTLVVVPFQSGISWKPDISDDGKLTGDVPAGQKTGDYIIRFNVDDRNGGVIQNMIEIRFRTENEAPIIHETTFSVKDNSHIATIAGAVSATDPDGDKLSYSILPESDPNKIFSIDANTGVIRLEKPELLNDKMLSAISLTVKADDNWLPSKASTAIVTVNIEHINTMPTAIRDSAETDKNTGIPIDVLHNDSDPNGDALKLVNVENSSGRGVVTVENNKIRYTPGESFRSLPEGETATDMFVYTVSDEKLEAKAPVLVVVNGVNTSPTISGTGIFSKIQDTDKITPFSSFVLSDPDTYKDGKKDIQTVTIHQTDHLADGHLILSRGFDKEGNGYYTITGTTDEVQQAVRNIVFVPVQSTKPFAIIDTHFAAVINNHAAVIPITDFATVSASSAVPVSEAYPAQTVWDCKDMIIPFRGISWADTNSDILGLSIEYGLPIFRLQQFKINDFDFGLKDETENVYEQVNRMLREARLLAETEEVNHADRNAQTWRIDIHPIQIR